MCPCITAFHFGCALALFCFLERRLVEARGREYTAEVHEAVLGLGMGAYLPVLKQVRHVGFAIKLELTNSKKK